MKTHQELIEELRTICGKFQDDYVPETILGGCDVERLSDDDLRYYIKVLKKYL